MSAQRNGITSQSYTFFDGVVLLTFILWIILGAAAYKEVGFNFSGFLEKLTPYALATSGVMAVKTYIKEFRPKSIAFASKLGYLLMLGIVSHGIIMDRATLGKFFQDDKTVVSEIEKQVKDTTDTYMAKINTDLLYRNCKTLGATVKGYRNGIASQLLKERVAEKHIVSYVHRIDSSLGDPTIAFCEQAEKFNRLRMEMFLLIQTKYTNNIEIADNVDDLLSKYNIPANALAKVQAPGFGNSAGISLRNYLVDIMQGLRSPFKEIKPPPFSRGGLSLDEFVFINT